MDSQHTTDGGDDRQEISIIYLRHCHHLSGGLRDFDLDGEKNCGSGTAFGVPVVSKW